MSLIMERTSTSSAARAWRGLVLSAQGLQQGYMWMVATEWLDSLVAIRPYWVVRTIAGASMDIGLTLLVYNLMRTALSSRTDTARAGGPAPTTAPVGGAR